MQGEAYTELLFFKEKDTSINKSRANQLSDITSYGTNIFYYKNTTLDPSSYKVSDYTGSGKSDLIKFDDSFIDIESVLAYDQFDIALIIEKEGLSGFYIYSDQEILYSITTEDNITEFSSVNYDNNYFYFIGNDGEGRYIYSVDEESYSLEKLAPVPEDGTNLNIINNWMYLEKMNSNEVYQLKPGDNVFKLLEI